MNNQHIGSSFDDFLAEEGLLAEAQAQAIKRVVVQQFRQYLEHEHISKTRFGREINTSRAALDRLLDEKNTSVSLSTLSKAAQAMGKNWISPLLENGNIVMVVIKATRQLTLINTGFAAWLIPRLITQSLR